MFFESFENIPILGIFSKTHRFFDFSSYFSPIRLFYLKNAYEMGEEIDCRIRMERRQLRQKGDHL
jgi:hypothetical protein